MGERRVLVYRETLASPSEPFVLAQGEGLTQHEAWYLSLRRSDAHAVPRERDLRWSTTSALARGAFKRWGWSPTTTRAVRDVSPVLVHAHFGRDAVQVLPLAERLGLPIVTTFHGHDATRTDDDLRRGSRSDRLYLARRQQLAEVGARFLAVSDAVRSWVIALGFPAERVERHHIGVDVDGIDSVAVADHDPGLVVFVGRLVAQKGLDDAIDAVALVPGARLVVVGDGPTRAASEARAAAGGVDATFVGFTSHSEAWRWMARASVVVVPSRTSADGRQEAFGLAAAEAQAAGTPVVATRSGGLPEAVAPACEDLLVDEGDVAAIAARLDALLASPPDARTRGADARDWVRRERNLEVQNRRLDEIYREVAP